MTLRKSGVLWLHHPAKLNLSPSLGGCIILQIGIAKKLCNSRFVAYHRSHSAPGWISSEYFEFSGS